MTTISTNQTRQTRSANPPQRWLAALPAALLACSLHGQAQGQAAEPASGKPAEVKYVTNAPSSAQNFVGDSVKFNVPILGKQVVLGANTGKVVCLGAGSKLRGIGVASIKEAGADPKEHAVFEIDSLQAAAKPQCGDIDLAQPGLAIAIDPDTLSNTPPNRHGWTYGTLIVPYKYQFGGDRSVSGGATLGGYMGYRTSLSGSSVAFITFAGPTKVDVAQMKDGKASTESLAGLSYGVGLLGTIKDGFKAGVVLGTDRVAKSAGYPNNGKPWISLSLGYDFTAQ